MSFIGCSTGFFSQQDEVVEGGHSGKFDGKRYFTCEDGCGLVLPLSRLKLDDRFDDPPPLKGGSTAAAAGGEDVEKDKHMPSHKQPIASQKPSDPLSPDLLKGAVKSEKTTADGIEASDDSSASGKFAEKLMHMITMVLFCR